MPQTIGPPCLSTSVSLQHALMINKALFASLGCLIVGLLLGAGGMYVVQWTRNTKAIANTAITTEFTKLGEAGEQAQAAYRHETKPVAIYALSQYLSGLQKAEGIPGMVPQYPIHSDMMLTHARLANLYAETGQSNLSTQHVAQAIACAKVAGHWSEITNWARLDEIVGRIDRNAKD